MFLYNDAPAGCYRTPERVKVWQSSGGLMGLSHRAPND